MCDRFQGKNLLIFGATFGLGLALANGFQTERSGPSDLQRPVRHETSVICVDIEETVPKVRIHTEREATLRDQIRVTENELVNIRRLAVTDSATAEQARRAKQKLLEAKLEQQVGRLRVLAEEIERLNFDGTKSFDRQVCHER